MRYKDMLKPSFVYVPCENLPGMIAIPLDEINEAIEIPISTNNINSDIKTENRKTED